MAAFNNVGPAEKKTAAKLEKLRKENPEEVENLLKTVQVPTTGPPNRSQWRKLELAMKFINKSKQEADHKGGGSPSKTCSSSSRPGTPNRKSITSIDGKDHERLVNRPLTKQATLVSLGKSGSSEGKVPVTVVAAAANTDPSSPRGPVKECVKECVKAVGQPGTKAAEATQTSQTTTTTTTQQGHSSSCSNSSGQASPRPTTSTAETNTDLSNKKISEVQTDDNAKVLLSKKTQTDISVKDDSDFVEMSMSVSPRNKKKPLKKQKSLSKITNSFGKIV